MSDKKTYNWCIVPKCVSTTVSTPEKLFFKVPFEIKMRNKWMRAIKRDNPPSNKSSVYCCEDHFDVENDMENYIKFKLVGGRRQLRKGVIPHKFQCQSNTGEKTERSAVAKRNRIKNIEKILNEDPLPLTPDAPEEIFVVCAEEDNRPIKEEDPLRLENDPCMEKTKRYKAIQVRIKNQVENKATITQEKLFKKEKNTKVNTKSASKESTSICSFTDSSSLTSAQYDPEKDLQSSETEDAEWELPTFKSHMQKAAVLCISREPQLLLELPKQCYFCKLLSETTKSTPRDVMITLKKIRLHQSNAVLALDFGLSESSVSTVIRRTIPE